MPRYGFAVGANTSVKKRKRKLARPSRARLAPMTATGFLRSPDERAGVAGSMASSDGPARAYFLWHFWQACGSLVANTTLSFTLVFPLWQVPHCSPAFILAMVNGPEVPLFILKTFTWQF